MKHATVSPDANPVAIVDRADLKTALDALKIITERRNEIPILANAKLAADAGQLLLVGTDLDLELRIRINGEVDGRMSTTLPTHLLQSMCVKATASERVSFTMLPGESDDEQDSNSFASDSTLVRFGSTDYRVNSLPVQDFPEMSKFEGKTWKFNLPGSALWNAIDATKEGMSSEETRYYLNGIYLHAMEDDGLKLRAVTTDGHRLYSQMLTAPAGAAGMPGIIVPRKTMTTLHKLLKGKGFPSSVSIRLNDTYVWFKWGAIELRSKLIDGTFPDYARVIPTGNEQVATFETPALVEAIDAVTVISSERGRAIKLTLTPGQCELAVKSPDSGSSQTTVPAETDIEHLEVGYNAAYLRDVVKKASPDWEDVTMKLSGPGDPVVITGSLNGWVGVLMPMRV